MDAKGVTLIELLIVMIIIAILSVVIFVSMTGALDDADKASTTDMPSWLPNAGNLNPYENSVNPDLIDLTEGDDIVPGTCGAANSACNATSLCCAGLQCCSGTCLTTCVVLDVLPPTCANVKEPCTTINCCTGLACCDGLCLESCPVDNSCSSLTTRYPRCDGPCETGYHCMATPVVGRCGCVPNTETDCDNDADDDQDGRTDCADSDCSVDPYCMCGGQSTCSRGICPEGYACESVRGGCACVAVVENSCGDITDTRSCDEGVCGRDEECVAVGPRECDCIPEDEYTCSYMSDDNYCSMGTCPRGENCQATGRGCECMADEPEYTCSDQYEYKCDAQTCPSDQQCVAVNSIDCECIPTKEYSCGYVDAKYCDIGTCGRDQYCTRSASGGCECAYVPV